MPLFLAIGLIGTLTWGATLCNAPDGGNENLAVAGEGGDGDFHFVLQAAEAPPFENGDADFQ